MTSIQSKLEYPQMDQIINDIIPIRGWAFSKLHTKVSIEVYIDEQLICSGNCSLPRFDIYEKTGIENAYESGFLGELTTEKFTDGSHLVKVIARTIDDEELVGEINIVKETQKLKILTNILTGRVTGIKSINLGGVGRNRLTNVRTKEFIEKFIKITKLQPAQKVLDVGCGMGIFAMQLTKYLGQKGEYYGLDNMYEVIDYCKKNITPKFPNFKFTVADLYNQYYNPDGKFRASDYKFPYNDQTFDCVCLFSVFTHLVPDDMKNYLQEISRVLKSHGKCYITYFLLNNWSLKQIESGLTEWNFKYQFDGFKSEVKKIPEQVIAYEESVIRQLYKEADLKILEPINFGKWTGLKDAFFGQDVIIAEKISR